MKILALETSTQHLSVALIDGPRCLVRSEVLANGGSDRLLPWVQAVLAEAGLTLQQLDGIAYDAGPGGFTGLRLACGVAQGLAFGADLPVVGVCSLEAITANTLAANTDASRVFACLDARMNEVYVAAYERTATDEYTCIMQPAVLPPDQVNAPDGEWQAAGDGFAAYADILLPRFPNAQADIFPTAEAVARLAHPRFARGEGQPAVMAAPLYVRDKVALTTAERLARGGAK